MHLYELEQEDDPYGDGHWMGRMLGLTFYHYEAEDQARLAENAVGQSGYQGEEATCYRAGFDVGWRAGKAEKAAFLRRRLERGA